MSVWGAEKYKACLDDFPRGHRFVFVLPEIALQCVPSAHGAGVEALAHGLLLEEHSPEEGSLFPSLRQRGADDDAIFKVIFVG